MKEHDKVTAGRVVCEALARCNIRSLNALIIAFAAFVMVVALKTSSAAAADLSSGELYSIEERHLVGTHELSTTVGSLPMDAFGTGLAFQGNYTYHFSHLFGWEVIGGTYSFVVGTGLSDELRDRFAAQPENQGDLIAILHSNFVFKPLYGKIAWLNDQVLSAEVFFVAGPALGFFDDQSRPFGIDVGIGLRFFLGKHLSLRLDIRDYQFFPDFQDVSTHLLLSGGVALSFGFSDDN